MMASSMANRSALANPGARFGVDAAHTRARIAAPAVMSHWQPAPGHQKLQLGAGLTLAPGAHTGPAPSPGQPSRRHVRPAAVAMPGPQAADAPQAAAPKLASIELHPFINSQGMVLPPEYNMPNGQPPVAFIFAVYDQHKKLQYIGFSRHLRNSLRTLLGRRPDKSFYYKAHALPVLDQAVMLSIKDAWEEEVGGAPPGNKLKLERMMWQSPVDAGAISARGKRAAAEDQVRQILEGLTIRGLTEKFVPNQELLDNGQVDFLPADDLSQEEREALLAQQAAAAAATRSAHVVIDGEERAFQVGYSRVQKTNGGYLVDARLTLDNRETRHRVIVGKQYIEGSGLTSYEPAVEAALATILATKQVRHTEGVMPVGQFPVNYFTVSETEQWFPEQFKDAFRVATGRDIERHGQLAWRFTRLHSYGPGTRDQSGLLDIGADEDNRLGSRTSSFVYE